MAFFGVTLEKIERVWPHKNADRLELAKVLGMDFQFVIPKGIYKEGDLVLYFPLDSILPTELVEKLGMVGKFSGKDKNRIRTLRLRGELSQGYVTKPDGLLPLEFMSKSPEEITNFLGVTKYEPPVKLEKGGLLMPLPSGLSKYDIEGAERFQVILEKLLEKKVVVMEKMEGTNFSVTRDSQGKVYVNQRNNTIHPIDGHEHSFWKVARMQGIIDFVNSFPFGKCVTVYGELCGPGIQKNIYNFKDHKVLMFDMLLDNRWICFEEFKQLLTPWPKLRDNLVPVLAEDITLSEFLGAKSIKEASNGKSALSDCLREGLVIKPMVEEYVLEFGRLILKQRSPEYLANEDD